MKNNTIRVGTRGSQLALWQTNHIVSLLKTQFPSVTFEIITIKTTGDKHLEQPLEKIGDKGLFTRELDDALLNDRVDIAVHSLKDIPTVLPEGLHIQAIPERGDVRDAFLSPARKPFDSLPRGSMVATGSLRRRAQLLHRRPDLNIVPVRGNVPTRIRKMEEHQWDGMVLAAAGLHRLSLQSHIVQYFPPDVLVPAVGQGALGVVCRTDDATIASYLQAIHHPTTAAAVLAERQFMRTLEGGCHVPIGALGWVKGTELVLTGMLASIDGTQLVKHQMSGDVEKPHQLGEALAQWILDHGGKEILTEMEGGTV